MNPVYQTIVDPGKGNCMQAAIASLFEKKLEEVPNFIEYPDNWFSIMWDFIRKQGYDYRGMLHNKNYNTLMKPTDQCFRDVKWHKSSIITPKNLYKYEGVNGYFYAGVFSPKYFNWERQTTHAVIIDRDYNIVHDPSPAYKDLKRYPLSNLLKYNGIIDVYLIEKQDGE